MTLTGSGPLDIPELSLLPGTTPYPAGPAGQPTAGTRADLIDSERGNFAEAVATALQQIADKKIEKVVLARKVTALFDQPVDIGAILARLRSLESASTIFAISSPGHAFIGASPELIAARDGAGVTSIPLAGSVPMTGDTRSDTAAAAAMVASSKENFEHRLVVDAVEAELYRWCSRVEVRDEPEVLWLRQIAHLATVVSGTLGGDPSAWPTALELAAALHPTPAVCGSPSGAALELIGALEPGGRGLYAGLVGWVDSSGDGEFYLGIRSGEIRGRAATVHAGAGIVAGSDPAVRALRDLGEARDDARRARQTPLRHLPDRRGQHPGRITGQEVPGPGDQHQFCSWNRRRDLGGHDRRDDDVPGPGDRYDRSLQLRDRSLDALDLLEQGPLLEDDRSGYPPPDRYRTKEVPVRKRDRDPLPQSPGRVLASRPHHRQEGSRRLETTRRDDVSDNRGGQQAIESPEMLAATDRSSEHDPGDQIRALLTEQYRDPAPVAVPDNDRRRGRRFEKLGHRDRVLVHRNRRSRVLAVARTVR